MLFTASDTTNSQQHKNLIAENPFESVMYITFRNHHVYVFIRAGGFYRPHKHPLKLTHTRAITQKRRLSQLCEPLITI